MSCTVVRLPAVPAAPSAQHVHMVRVLVSGAAAVKMGWAVYVDRESCVLYAVITIGSSRLV